ncbi:sulfur carrier protein ThiS [Echinimonas agarilytica]|uniref:Sulfur carrier protein ThiS n=1 Tax=Echinimonas agarilytica TaxID=1215918 RepID=A0AA41WAX6_9GAMM|nr:sulfur carrier protein ThiS [Echinimonas agarilytica]MCM2681081.1 sulfur carrier protein ThiS [Echinimonas agarilytica]
MNIFVNSEAVTVPDGASATDVLTQLESLQTGVAIAINQTIIPQNEWPTKSLSEGDHVALFRAIAGG